MYDYIILIKSKIQKVIKIKKIKKNYYEMRVQCIQSIEDLIKTQKKVERDLIYLMVLERFGINNKKFVDNYVWLKVKAGFFGANKEFVWWCDK